MDRRRSNPYAKAYAFPTEGSSALAAEKQPLGAGKGPSPSPAAVPPAIRWHSPVQRGVRVPAWVMYLCIAGAFFVFAFALLHMRTGIAGAQKQAVELERQLARAEEINQALEVKIESANDPERIHAVATNWLKMRIPSPDEIQMIPFFAEGPPEAPYRQPTEGGFFRLLLSFFLH